MKKLNSVFLIGIALVALAVLAGCSSTKPTFDARANGGVRKLTSITTLTNTLDPAWLQNSANFFTLGPGDAIDLELLGEAAQSNGGSSATNTIVVGPDGKIYFQFLPGLDVWGKTLAETKSLIEDEMAKYVKYSASAKVGVSLRAIGSKQIWLLGRVTRPGIYPMTGPMTLLEALSLAGGPARAAVGGSTEDQADLRHSFVVRGGQFIPVDFQRLLNHGDLTQNIYLQPDDFIYLPSSTANEVYVMGAVQRPTTVPYSDHLTLVSAIANANGPIGDAYPSHVAIVRGSMTQPEVAIVDYNAVVTGKESDVLLEPHDIVYVPFKPFLTLRNYARGILFTFANTLAANEGANAIVEDADRVGISVPPNSTGPSSSTVTPSTPVVP